LLEKVLKTSAEHVIQYRGSPAARHVRATPSHVLVGANEHVVRAVQLAHCRMRQMDDRERQRAGRGLGRERVLDGAVGRQDQQYQVITDAIEKPAAVGSTLVTTFQPALPPLMLSRLGHSDSLARPIEACPTMLVMTTDQQA
jgi:hypothetical protein